VFTLRILKGQSPFHADRTHLHHRMLRLGMSHLQAALFIHSYTAVMVALGFCIPAMAPTLAFFLLLGCAFTLPLVIMGMERMQVLLRAVRQKSKFSQH